MFDAVQCVSLPRSGHNLLVVHLQKYFDSTLTCQNEKVGLLSFRSRNIPRNASDANKFHYCEYYYACRSHPCKDSNNSFQKSHDFELSLAVDQARKYLIQKRNPLDLLISWFEMRLLKNRERDTPDGFAAFVERMHPYINGFIEKWVDAPLPHRLVFDYEDYLQSPAEHLKSAIEFFGDNLDVDMIRINEIVKDVKAAKDNRNFRFIDAAPKTMCA